VFRSSDQSLPWAVTSGIGQRPVLPRSGLELVKLALMVYELVEQVEEAGFVVVADALDVPQA
jgi:hypothetical protein